MPTVPARPLAAACVLLFLAAASIHAEPVRVRFAEASTHGFLQLRSETGALLADGEMVQQRRGTRVTSRLMFFFRDGSRYDETTVFDQRREFRLVSEHVVQRGPAFPQPLDLRIDATTGSVTVRYRNKDGEEKIESEHLDLPADLANGMVQTLLKNVDEAAPPKAFAYLAASPKPRIVKLVVSAAGHDRFSVGRLGRMATHYVLKVDIGGLTGVVADVLGKTPPDSHVWILKDGAPSFVRAEQPFFADGPLWRVELAAPVRNPPEQATRSGRDAVARTSHNRLTLSDDGAR